MAQSSDQREKVTCRECGDWWLTLERRSRGLRTWTCVGLCGLLGADSVRSSLVEKNQVFSASGAGTFCRSLPSDRTGAAAVGGPKPPPAAGAVGVTLPESCRSFAGVWILPDFRLFP